MLNEFILANRAEIIERTRAFVRERRPQEWLDSKLEHGVPLFLTQLVGALAPHTEIGSESLLEKTNAKQQIVGSAELHGHELLRHGFTLAQVVHAYGDICQVVTALAGEKQAPISAEEFQVFNRCLDEAIAAAVTAHARLHDDDVASQGTVRFGAFGHELRNLLSSALVAFDIVRRGTVGLNGSTGAVIARSLAGMSALIERSLAEVRLEAGLPVMKYVSILEFMAEIEVSANMQAEARGTRLTIEPIGSEIAVNADRQLLASAVTNLLQNAFKFTHPGGNVTLATQANEERVFIEVRDECGGLPPGKAEELFRPFSQKGNERSGLGLGLSIALGAARAHGGDIHVRDIPGEGCVFVLEVPRAAAPPPAGLERS
jgi:signal transduction histidine kinase